MIDKRLQYDRQMYAMGQRVAKSLDGLRPGYRGGAAQDSGNAENQTASAAAAGSSGTSSGSGSGHRGPAEFGLTTRGPAPTTSTTDDGESFLSTVKDFVMKGGIVGAGIRGLGNVFGGPTTKDNTAPDQRNMHNVAGPVDGPDFGVDGEGEGQGIMSVYNPYILPVEGEGEEAPVSQEEEDFIQRYRVANQFRQDKQGQLDPAILEMISKLYT